MGKKHKLFFGLILLIGLFLRLFQLGELFHFTMDEALIAFRGWGLFNLNRPFLIGGISPLQVHLPPYFYYLSALLLVPFQFHPLGWGAWAAVIGLATIFSLYYLTKKIFNPNIALISSLLYATSFTAVFFDRHYWPLVLNPLLTISTLILLTKLNQKSIRPYLALALVLAFALTADPSNLPLILTVMAYYFFHQKKLSPKFSLGTLLGAGAVFLAPLLAFDLRHHWQNFSGVHKLFQTASRLQFSWAQLLASLLLLPRSLARFWYSAQTNLIQLYSYCIPYAQARQHQTSWVLVILAVLILIWFIKQSTKPIPKTIVNLILFYFLGIIIFGALGFSIFDHYLAGLLPIFAIITALVITRLPQFASFLAIFLFLAVNLYQLSQVSNPYGLVYKQALVNWANQKLKSQSFALDSVSKCHKENGLRYLFELTENPPVISFMDPNFFWLYQTPPQKDMPDKILLVTDKSLNLSQPVIAQQTFGALTAIILDNSDKSYQINY